MKTCPHPVMLAAGIPLGVLAAVLVTGCASIVREPTVEVWAMRNAMAPEREQKTYLITCSSDLVQQWLAADRKALLALDEALQKLGYEEAANPTQATYVIVAELGFARRPKLEENTNPDSIRFQNVAGMVGEGRYRQILTERGDSGGSLLMGPDGQIIPTGAWKRIMEDGKPRENNAAGTHDSLILRAWDVADGGSARIPAWEVVVLRTLDYRRPSPEHVGIMVRHAAERLDAGWPAAAPQSPVAPAADDRAAAPATRSPQP